MKEISDPKVLKRTTAAGMGAFPVLVNAGLPGLSWAGFNLALTPEMLNILLAGLLAVCFDWFPGLAPRFDGLSKIKKQQLMLLLLGLVAGTAFAGSCYGWFESGLACSKQSLPLLLQYVLTAAGVNQAVHLLTKP